MLHVLMAVFREFNANLTGFDGLFISPREGHPKAPPAMQNASPKSSGGRGGGKNKEVGGQSLNLVS